jgi:VanZ family protein
VESISRLHRSEANSSFIGWKVKPHGRVAVIMVSLLIAFSLEGIQYFIPYRVFNNNDLEANGIGVIFSI